MELNEFSNVLWRERRLMELLVFKLGEEKLVLAAGRADWLVHAAREVDAVVAEMQSVEVERAVSTQSLGATLGLGGLPTLAELATVAPAPWRGILEDHRRALIDLLDTVEGVARSGRGLPGGMQRLVPQVLPASSTSSTSTGGDEAEAGAAADSRSGSDGESNAGSTGTIDMIVEELRGLGAAAAEPLHCATVHGPERPHSVDGDELARVAVGLQIEEIAQLQARPSPMRAIRVSLLEFLG